MSFTRYQGCIRFCYYTAAHNPGWTNPKGLLFAIGFVLLALPYGLYYRVTGKTPPDLELL
jgi:hypothetical protein